MSQRPLFLDMDPGIDDALAIAVLASQSTLRITGASAVHGNVSATQGARNFRGLLKFAGLPDVPVRVGAQRPLAQEVGYAPRIHGADGVGGEAVRLPEAETPPIGGVELLLAQSRNHPGDLEIVATGPLTTLALALIEDPTLPQRVRRVHVMGGAFWSAGNITPRAEANIYHDPEAAARVFAAGWPITVCGLDVTMQVLLEEADLDRLEAAGGTSPFLGVLARMTRFYAQAYTPRLGRIACPLHDPLTALCVVTPDLVDTVDVPVAVETGGIYSRGATLPEGGAGPVSVARSVDVPAALAAFEDAVYRHSR